MMMATYLAPFPHPKPFNKMPEIAEMQTTNLSSAMSSLSEVKKALRNRVQVNANSSLDGASRAIVASGIPDVVYRLVPGPEAVNDPDLKFSRLTEIFVIVQTHYRVQIDIATTSLRDERRVTISSPDNALDYRSFIFAVRNNLEDKVSAEEIMKLEKMFMGIFMLTTSNQRIRFRVDSEQLGSYEVVFSDPSGFGELKIDFEAF